MNHASFNHIVVGRGLIGAAAARHLSAAQAGVALIGPDEPQDKATHEGVFGSHYDEGRITRVVAADITWATLAQRSIQRYRDLEAQSGVPFYQNVGILWLDQPDYHSLAQCEQACAPLGAEFERLSAGQINERFPFLSLAAPYAGLYEAQPGGHISPRNLVKAQTAVAQAQGAHVINSVVRQVRAQGPGVEVVTVEGHTYRAQRALIAAGGFANACELPPRRLKVTVSGRTIIFAKVGEAQLQQLAGMPSIGNYGRLGDKGPEAAYILPPIQYPDGNFYVKMGMGSDADPRMETLADLRRWFQSDGSAEQRPLLWQHLKSILPILAGAETHTAACVVTNSASGLPYIDFVEGNRIGVAVAGCGAAAKSSDELGRIAAAMIAHGEWACDWPAEWFKARFA